MRRELLRDSAKEGRLIRGRLLLAFIGVFALMGVLAARMTYLQLASYEHYHTLSQKNRVRLVAIPPTRGLIFDRDGELLAENRPAYRLAIIPEQVPDMAQTLERLGNIMELRATDLERFRAALRHHRPFQEVTLKTELTEAEVARFAVNRHRFPGVDVKAHLTRYYPYGPLFAHVVGYVGRISERDLRRIDASDYQGSSYIGKTGIERYYEDVLHGDVGVKRVEANALGRVLRTLERTPPVPGRDLYLTIDVDLQRVARQALGEYSGAVVAIDPDNGEILAMVSKPAFDPNLFVNGISLDAYRALQTQRDHPLFNRIIRGQYPPGSTIKPFVALAGLETGTKTREDTVYDPGWYSLPGADARWRCWKDWGHGWVDMREAIVESCDVYFYDLAYEMGISAMHDFLSRFGFGMETGIDLLGEHSGVLPSKEWKRRVKGKPWYHGETVIAGIGQGYNLTTPLQLAVSTAMLANRGRPVRPHLLQATRNAAGGKEPTAVPEPVVPPLELERPERWEFIIDAMEGVMHGAHGTARSVGRGAPYRIAGKSGTAQVFSIENPEEYDPEELAEELRDHALFIAFAPADDPEIVVSVIAENGGSGSGTAAPIARAVLDAWLLRESGLPGAAAKHGDEADVDAE